MNKKILLIITTVVFFSSPAFSGCLKQLDNDLISTKKQLAKYECSNSKKNQLNCTIKAPRGWKKYYKNKLKYIEKKALKCLS